MDKKFSNLLLLLQINDPFFPLGAYTQSYGLETYVQKGIVKDKQTALNYIESNIGNSLLFNDFLAVKLAYEIADIHSLKELDAIYYASKAPKEIRLAGEKLGSRFIKNIKALELKKLDLYEVYCSMIERCECKGQFPLVYGVFCSASGIEKEEAIKTFAYAQVSGIVNNCVKLIPLSQTEGQDILHQSYEFIYKAVCELEHLGIDDLGLSAPAFELRAMQHETLYSRLYMS